MSNESESPNGAPAANTVGSYQITPTVDTTASGTTKFADDADGVTSSVLMPSSLIGSLSSIVSVPGAEDIVTFLKKPVRVLSGAFSTTDTGTIASFDPWTTIISDPVMNKKLAGVYLMRADIVLKIVFNATRFQMGRYIMGWVPSGGLPNSNQSYLAMYRAHRANLTSITTLPNVQFDLSTQSHAELRIKFTSAYPMHNVLTESPWSNFSLGFAFVTPYVPLQAGSGNSSAPYTIFANFENIELSMPTINHGYAVADNHGPSPTGVEQLAKNGGPVTSFVAKVSMAAMHLQSVPLLGAAVTQVGWTAGHLARALNVFGFSKPTNVTMPQRFVRNTIPLAANSDTFSTAQPLSLLASNEVIIHSGVGGTDIDEMDIGFIAKQYATCNVVAWTTAMVLGANIITVPIAPSSFKYPYGKGYVFTPLALAAMTCRYWRGSIKFRIRIVKTDFHSGRLIVGFIPKYRGQSTTPMTDSEATYLYREIIDVREVNEAEFCIPYVSPELYSEETAVLGNFTISILDPLVCPNTVTGTAYIAVEVAGGDDIEFAYPVVPEMSAYVPAEVQSGYSSVPCYELGPKENYLTTTPSSVAIGELFRSFRQIGKRFNYALNFATPTAYNDAFFYYAFLNTATTQITNNSNPLLKDSSSSGDFISLLGSMYLFSSGGLRVMILPRDTNAAAGHIFVSMDQVPSDTPISTCKYSSTWPVWGAGRVISNTVIDPIIDVQVPSYTRTIARINAAQLVNSADSRLAPSAAVGSNTTFVGIDSKLSSYNTPRLYDAVRCMGDDFSMSGWYGVVPLVNRTDT